jgi:hypothetical protein
MNEISDMQIIIDEYGRPFIVIREQAQKQRIRGLEAQKVTKERRNEKRKTFFLFFLSILWKEKMFNFCL